MQCLLRANVCHDSAGIIGLKIRTNMSDAPRNCPNLWNQHFAERIPGIARFERADAYRVSWMVDPKAGIFDYWAALAVS